MGKQWKQCQTLFFWAPKSLQMVTAAMKLKDAYSLDLVREASQSGRLLAAAVKGNSVCPKLLLIHLSGEHLSGFQAHRKVLSLSSAQSE